VTSCVVCGGSGRCRACDGSGQELRWLTVAQAADHLRVSPATIYRWVADGLIPRRVLPAGRGLRFDRRELDAALGSHG